MFNRPTVFVLGAGASFELGFPLGEQLATDIRNFLKLEEEAFGLTGKCRDLLLYCISERQMSQQLCIEAARKIYDGLRYFNSIDDYLDHRQDTQPIVDLGKMAVAQVIMEREERSPLKQIGSRSLTDVGLRDKWIFKFVKMLVKGVPRSKVDDVFKNVSFITFNYDRSLEYFLIQAITEACDINPERALSLVKAVPIHHVYGSLGKLPGFEGKLPAIQFGRRVSPRDINFITEGIRTYTESFADKAEADAIRKLTRSASKIVFLGCGFHSQNIQILTPLRGISEDCEIIATTHGLSQTNTDTVCRRLVALYRNEDPFKAASFDQSVSAGLHPMTCSQLMDEYSLGLTD